MTPLEAIAYLHGTLPKRPELYEDDEYTAALIALGPLVIAQLESPAQVRSDEAQPAEPLFTGTVCDDDEGGLFVTVPPDDVDAVELRERVDVYRAGSRPAPRKVTAEDVDRARKDWVVTSSQDVADALNAILASKAEA
jgi:hypothetical protein